MKIKFNSNPMNNYDGENLKERTIDGWKDLTEKSICIAALTNYLEGDEKIPSTERLVKFNLANRIFESKNEIELSSEEIVLILNLVSKNRFSTLIYGKIYKLLEGKTK